MTQQNMALEIVNLCAAYGKRQVLHGLDMPVFESETFGIIGLNGAGKTTLIKTILGLKDQTSGEVKIFGMDKISKEVKNNIAYLPERFDPPWFLTGSEFIHFSAQLYKRQTDAATIEKYCNDLALDPSFIDRKVQSYSKGMRQKLGLIATFLTGCPILILDEPMSGLDPLARALVKDLLLTMKAQGRTVVLSSHILSDMDEICDRISVIHNGVIHYTGTPEAFRESKNESSLERAFLHIVRPQGMAA